MHAAPRRRLPISILAASALFAALALAPSVSADAPRHDFIGISTEDVVRGSSAYRAEQLPRQRQAGIGLIRQNFDWATIEVRRGRYRFGFYDEMVGAAARNGIRIMPVLYNPPSFHSTAPLRGRERGVYPPRRAAAMGRFARALVRRYGRGGSYWRSHPEVPAAPIRSWQVWNEPNLPVYWRPRPSARAYGRLLRTVYRYIRRSDRRAEVVTAGIPPTTLPGSIPYTRFIRDMARSGGRFNTLAVNSYARNTRVLSSTVRSARRAVRRGGRGRARVWITELGWGTGGPSHRFNVGFAKQARLIESSLDWIGRNRKRLKLRGVVYFQWRDQVPYPPAYKDMWGLHTGLINLDAVAKPGLGAFTEAARRSRR